MDRDAADQLDVEMDHIPRQVVLTNNNGPSAKTPRGIFHRRKRLRQDLLQRRTLVRRGLNTGPELVRLRPKPFVSQRLVLFLEFVDADNGGLRLLQELLVMPA